MKNTGFHVHIYFDLNNKPLALQVYHALAHKFPIANLGRIHDKPIGPHTKPMFQVIISPDMFESVVTWLMFNRAGLDVLVHPTTGNDIADHTQHMLWIGNPVPLDINKL